MVDLSTLDAELAALNEEVSAALAKRRSWMDAHMKDYARYKIGDVIFDGCSGARLGVVSDLYRYHAKQNPFYDTAMSIEYRYCTGGNFYDNTSRQPGRSIKNAQEMAEAMQQRAERILNEQKDTVT